MGYRGGNDIVITNVVGPGPNAIHTRNSFTPDHEWQQKEINHIYDSSNRINTYLGDWHSHPNGALYLGWQDKRTLNRIASCVDARVPNPIMMVVSGGLEKWKLGAWFFVRKSYFSWGWIRIRSLTIKIY